MHSVHQALGLDIPEFDLRTRKKFLKALYKKCGCHSILPKTMHIPVCYNRMTFPLFKGGFGDVWKGGYSNREVAVKVLRVHSDSDLQKIIGVGFWSRPLITCKSTDRNPL